MRRGVFLLAALLSIHGMGALAVQAETADSIMESRKIKPLPFTPITKLKIKPPCVDRCERHRLVVCRSRTYSGSGCSCHTGPKYC